MKLLWDQDDVKNDEHKCAAFYDSLEDELRETMELKEVSGDTFTILWNRLTLSEVRQLYEMHKRVKDWMMVR